MQRGNFNILPSAGMFLKSPFIQNKLALIKVFIVTRFASRGSSIVPNRSILLSLFVQTEFNIILCVFLELHVSGVTRPTMQLFFY
jgi:hypothetical protein